MKIAMIGMLMLGVVLGGFDIGVVVGYHIAKDQYKCKQVGGTRFLTDEHTYKVCK